MKKQRDTSRRIRLAGLAIISLFIALAAAAYFSGREVKRSSELVVKDAVPGTIASHNMRMAMSRGVGWVMVAASAQTPQSRDASLSIAHDADAAFTNAVEQYETTIKINPVEDRALLARVTSTYAEYYRQRMAYEALILAGNREGSAAFLETNLVPAYVSALAPAEDLIKYNSTNSVTYANYIRNSVHRLYLAVAVVMVLSLICASVLIVDLSIRRREVRKLRESEQKYRDIVEQSPLGIFQSSAEGRLISVNSALAAMFGSDTPEQMIKDNEAGPTRRYARPEQRQEIVRAASESPVSIQREVEHRRRDGTTFPTNLYIRAVRAANGTIQYLEGFVEDISIRKRAVEQLEMLKVAIDRHFDAAYWVDTNNQFIYVNDSACKTLGYTREELIGKPLTMIAPNTTPQILQEVWKHLRETGFFSRESVHRRKDGSEFPVEIVASYVRFGDKEFNCGFARDITGRKQAEESLRRINRELRAISDCNQVLVRAEDENKLLQDICQIVCEKAGYHMAWVGYADQDEGKTVRPVAWAGAEDQYLASAAVSWADTERGRGPVGAAIRTGATTYIHDFITDPTTAPWREAALQRGFRSGIALPLKDENGHPFGALTIYSAEPNSFTADEIRLLEELAGDLAFGITTLRHRVERKRAQESLQQSVEEVRRRNAELERFNLASVGRELRMVELKAEINGFLRQTGQPPRYRVDFTPAEPQEPSV